jgi:hypothetical protein
MSTPKSSLDKNAMRQRIAEGNKRRSEEAHKQRVYDDEIRQEQEETELMQRGDISKFISNIIISLIFVSLPLTEPVVDWVQVGVFAVANAVWNVFFHRHTWMHYATFVMINVLLVQWTHELHNIPRWIASVPPMILAGAVLINATVAAAGYFLYIDKVTKKRERDERLDVLMSSMIVANIIGLVATGVIPLAVLYAAFKGLVGLIS